MPLAADERPLRRLRHQTIVGGRMLAAPEWIGSPLPILFDSEPEKALFSELQRNAACKSSLCGGSPKRRIVHELELPFWNQGTRRNSSGLFFGAHASCVSSSASLPKTSGAARLPPQGCGRQHAGCVQSPDLDQEPAQLGNERPKQFAAAMLQLLGLNHEKLTYYHNGGNRRLTDVHGHVIEKILA